MKKLKLLPTILMLVLCVGVLAIGIYAVTPTKNTISGSITINASNADVTITAYKDSTSGTKLGSIVVRSYADLQIPTLEFVTENLNTIDQVQDVTIVVVFTTSSADNLVIETKDYESLDALDADDNVYTNMVTGQKTHLSTVTDTATKLPAFNKENPYTITCTYSLNNFATQELTVPLKIKFDIYKASEYSVYTTTQNGDDTIYTFGSFPQSEVTDTTLISSLTDTYTNYLAYDDTTGGQTYNSIFEDANGNQYVQIINVYNMIFADGKTVIQQTDITKYYKIEPLQWTQKGITNAETNTAMLLCNKIVEQVKYYLNDSNRTIDGNTVYANNYKYSNLRYYLNTTFYYNAFNSLEKSLISEQTVDNSASTTDNTTTNKYACENTNDNIFALSYQDLMNAKYGYDTSTGDSATRFKTPTAYATGTGVNAWSKEILQGKAEYEGYTSIEEFLANGYGKPLATSIVNYLNANQSLGGWWSRSPLSYGDYYAYFVEPSGFISSLSVDSTSFGAVPALHLSIQG